jgi:hypothetical protein
MRALTTRSIPVAPVPVHGGAVAPSISPLRLLLLLAKASHVLIKCRAAGIFRGHGLEPFFLEQSRPNLFIGIAEHDGRLKSFHENSEVIDRPTLMAVVIAFRRAFLAQLRRLG